MTVAKIDFLLTNVKNYLTYTDDKKILDPFDLIGSDMHPFVYHIIFNHWSHEVPHFISQEYINCLVALHNDNTGA